MSELLGSRMLACVTDRWRWFLIAAILAAGFGVVIGRFVHFVGTIPNLTALWAGILAMALLAVTAVAVLIGIGMARSAIRRPAYLSSGWRWRSPWAASSEHRPAGVTAWVSRCRRMSR